MIEAAEVARAAQAADVVEPGEAVEVRVPVSLQAVSAA